MPSLFLALLLGQLQPLPPNLVALDSDEGRILLGRASSSRALTPLLSDFVTQDTNTYCGVASSVMILNAMPVEAPVAEAWAPFRLFTQENFFDAADPLGPRVKRAGLTVDQVATELEQHHVAARPVHADDSSEAAFRQDASDSLAQPSHFVLIDFLRAELHQDRGAHWSPLAAYDSQSDRFLVLDVARFRYPPYWATAGDLFRAMNTPDPDSGKSRGYVLISPATGAPPRVTIPPVAFRGPPLQPWLGGPCWVLLGAAVGALLTYLFGIVRRRRAGLRHEPQGSGPAA